MLVDDSAASGRTEGVRGPGAPQRMPVGSERGVLATVAALERVLVRDVPFVFDGGMAAVRRCLDQGLLVLDDGCLRATDAEPGMRALAGLPPAERLALHRRLSTLPLPAAEVARQLDLSVPEGEHLQLAAALEDAAYRAERLGMMAEALDLWARAGARSPSTERADRELRRAELASAAGDFRQAAAALAAIEHADLGTAQALRWAELEVTALGVASGMETVRTRFELLVGTLPLGSDARVVLELKLAGLETDAAERLRRLEALLPQIPDGPLRFSALSDLLYARVNAGHGLDQGVLADLRRLERTHGALQLEDTPDALEAFLAYQVDDVATTRRLMPTLLGRARAEGNAGLEDILLVHAALTDVVRGRFASAADRLARSAEIAARPPGSPAAVRAGGTLALELGQDDELARIIALPHGSGTEAIGHLTRTGLQGLALGREGETAPTIRLLEECLATSRGLGHEEPGRRMWIDVELARAYVRHGDLDRAAAISDSMRALARRTGRALPQLQSDRIDAWLARAEGRQTASRAHARAVLHAAEHVIWMPERARILVDAIALLGEEASGTDTGPALSRSGRSVLRVLEDGVAGRALSFALQRLETVPLAQLTPSERRVAESVAQGRSNAETAAELFLSVRTVEAHLNHVYRKLSMKSRNQLIAALAGP
jgi:DNA-binding CsgD family transcriptional regulator/tetratricopeptide (TPR) repeat protein